MKPAMTSQRFGNKTRLLTMTSNHQIQHQYVKNFIDHLNPGDLLVVNRSATLPSSFRGHLKRTGEFVEIRLAAFQGPTHHHLENWLAFSFGKGDWTQPTEQREPPPSLAPGDQVIFGPGLALEVICVKYDRLLEIRFISSSLEQNLYRYGKPIQYSYHKSDLEVWDQQTLFSGPPISVEPPSASFPLTWDLVLALRKKEVVVADLLHSAGISSTGSAELDQLLPLTEWYKIPMQTALEFQKAKQNNRKIVAMGTTVLRAMESAWDGVTLKAGSGLTQLKMTPGYQLHTANALVTGMHEVGTSHMLILDCLCPIEQIRLAYSEAEYLGYRGHEYGDLSYLHCQP